MLSAYADHSVATEYARVAVPAHFGPAARALVSFVDIRSGSKILDVGTGTGAAAAAARTITGPRGLAVGIDASFEMLCTARSTAALPAAIASATRLPFSGEAFDIVTAAFVLSHIRDYGAALAEIARVCTAGGRVGVSAWGAAGSGASTWSRVASHYTAIDRVERAVDDAIPWHQHFSRPGALGRALCEAGLVDVRETTRQIVVRVPTVDYVAMKCASVEGAILRHALDSVMWTAFIASITSALGREFGATVEYTRETHLARGTRR